MNANETCEDSIHGPYEPDDVADHCGEICEACWRLVCREHAKRNPEYAQYECPACYDRWDCGER